MSRSSTTFKPGTSGNPAGRKKGVERRFREVAESRTYTTKDGTTYTGLDALAHVLLDIALNPAEEAKDRRAAVDSYIDRGWGKVKQAIELSGEIETQKARTVRDMSDEDIARAREAIATLRQINEADEDAPTEH